MTGRAIEPIDGFRFFVLSNDHEPAHVHVRKGKGKGAFEVKIDISGSEAILVKGEEHSRAAADAKLRRKAMKLVNEHLKELQQVWKRIHG
ncbi:MAG: DUF4160 domain-containing protein [Cyanobacteria bacterium J06634_6]